MSDPLSNAHVLFPGKRLVVCAGPGGVGKTSTAAALGVAFAREGRRVLVSTIDPAPRLVDALHMPRLLPEPEAVPADVARALGIEAPGSLSAVRLDTAHSFRKLIEDEVADVQGRERIYASVIYREITKNLTGAMEHAATLALHDLQLRGGWDVLVLDTPPTSNALDFVEAPRRLSEALASPAIGWLVGRKGGRLSGGRFSAGGALVLRTLARLVGSRFLDEVGAFLADFHIVMGGFLARAESVDRLLRGPDVAVVLVMSPEAPSVDEALGFCERLTTVGLRPSAFVVNRALGAPGLRDARDLLPQLNAQAALADLPRETIAEAARVMADAANELALLASAQESELGRLGREAPLIPVGRVPLLAEEAGSLPSLDAAARHLARELGRPTAA